MKTQWLAMALLGIMSFGAAAQSAPTPIMGWSSWNNFRIHINEDLIKAQADVMAQSGMKEAGYRYVNIDDGFFFNRDQSGALQTHPDKFPGGMKALAEYIHNKGLRAGIYAEAGQNTCAWQWDADDYGAGAGSYGYERQDIDLMLNTWGYDFLKVDYCGAKDMGLDEQSRYTLFSKHIRELKPEAVYNVCRWTFPGTWVMDIADSWRISGDISAHWSSIAHIIELAKYTAPYSGVGYFNDLDMLQIGRGMSADEDKAHFTMWCMMNSPLLAGNDLREMNRETLDILTNKEVIALNQDPACIQAEWLRQVNDCDIYLKPLGERYGKEVALAILNAKHDSTRTCSIDLSSFGLEGKLRLKDLWTREEFKLKDGALNAEIPAHGVKVYRIKVQERVLPRVYEAEYAFAKGYNASTSIGKIKGGRRVQNLPDATVVRRIGRGDYLEWQHVAVAKSASFRVTISSYFNQDLSALITVNGEQVKNLSQEQGTDGLNTLSFEVELNKGENSIRMDSEAQAWVNVDKLTITAINN